MHKKSIKKKTLLLVVFLLVAICGATLLSFKVIGNNSSSVLFKVADNDATPLQSLNANGKSGKVPANNAAYLVFTPAQMDAIRLYYVDHATAAFVVEIAIPKLPAERLSQELQSPKILYYGYLSTADFSGGTAGDFVNQTKIEDGTAGKVLAGGDLRPFMASDDGNSTGDPTSRYTPIYISFALEKGIPLNTLPVGVFLMTAFDVKVTQITLTDAKVGYDVACSPQFFGVASNGGTFGYGNVVDFTGCAGVFATTNANGSQMPALSIEYERAAGEQSATKRYFTMATSGDIYHIYKPSGTTPISVTVQTQLLAMPFSRYEIKATDVVVKRLLMQENALAIPAAASSDDAAIVPLKTDVGLIPVSKPTFWRKTDYELYEWDRFPRVLVFDTKNYSVQRDFFRRLAFFCEKKGYRGRVLSDEELGKKHGYNAHDYSASGLARFFTAVKNSGVAINERESCLLQIALQNRLIEQVDDGYEPLSGAVISISQESELWLRRNLSNHELWHGLYFTDSAFVSEVANQFDALDDTTRNFIVRYWDSQPTLGYDTKDTDLVHNEYMAYLLQQPLGSVAEYFVHLANRGSVMEYIPRLCAIVRDNEGVPFTRAARKLDAYIFARWSLGCGRAGLVY